MIDVTRPVRFVDKERCNLHGSAVHVFRDGQLLVVWSNEVNGRYYASEIENVPDDPAPPAPPVDWEKVKRNGAMWGSWTLMFVGMDPNYPEKPYVMSGSFAAANGMNRELFRFREDGTSLKSDAPFVPLPDPAPPKRTWWVGVLTYNTTQMISTIWADTREQLINGAAECTSWKLVAIHCITEGDGLEGGE